MSKARGGEWTQKQERDRCKRGEDSPVMKWLTAQAVWEWIFFTMLPGSLHKFQDFSKS